MTNTVTIQDIDVLLPPEYIVVRSSIAAVHDVLRVLKWASRPDGAVIDIK